MLGINKPQLPNNHWCNQLNRFVKNHQQELAALSWGLWLENGNSQGTIGIDLQPQPHFVYCPQEHIESLNHRVDNKLQEILGIIDNYQPELEVLMIGIGKEQIQLIYFQPESTPPDCFQQIGKDVDSLLELLETAMKEKLQLTDTSSK